MVICLERGADLHMAQLMPLPVTVSCFSKIQIGFNFLVPAYPGSPGQRAVKRVCVCCAAAGDIGFDGIILPDSRNELGLYAGSVREPNTPAVDVSQLSLSPSSSGGNRSVENENGELPMETDAVVETKSPEHSRILLSTTIVTAGPADGDDVYDYGMLTTVSLSVVHPAFSCHYLAYNVLM